jgi:hypothetical protein
MLYIKTVAVVISAVGKIDALLPVNGSCTAKYPV